MTSPQTPARRAFQTLALLGLLAAGGAWAQPQSCAPQAAAVNATSPGLDQRVRENARQFNTNLLPDHIARVKRAAMQEPERALMVCIFEQELAARSGGNVAVGTSPTTLRGDPKVFGRSARGG